MGGTPLLLAIAVVLVDFGWEADGQNGYRYIVQIPAEQYESVRRQGSITSEIPEQLRGRVTSIEVRIGDRPVPRPEILAVNVQETSYPAPPDTFSDATVRAQGNDGDIKIPSLDQMRQTGTDAVNNMANQAQQGISNLANQTQQAVQDGVNSAFTATQENLRQRAEALLNGQSGSGATAPSTGSPTTFPRPTTNPTTQAGAVPPRPSTTAAGSSTPYIPPANNYTNMGTSGPTTSPNPPSLQPDPRATNPTAVTNPNTALTTQELTFQDYWSMDRRMTAIEQSERDERLLNEVHIGAGEVFTDSKTGQPLSKFDPRYSAMADYMKRFYEQKERATAAANARGTTTVTSPAQPYGQRDALTNMQYAPTNPTFPAGQTTNTNPYFQSQQQQQPTTQADPAYLAVLDELKALRQQEAYRQQQLSLSDPRLAMNGGNLNGMFNNGTNGTQATGNTGNNGVTQTNNSTRDTQTSKDAAANTDPVSASDLRKGSSSREETTRFNTQSFYGFLFILSTIINIYMGIALSRLLRRYRNLVAAQRGMAVNA